MEAAKKKSASSQRGTSVGLSERNLLTEVNLTLVFRRRLLHSEPRSSVHVDELEEKGKKRSRRRVSSFATARQ